MTILLTGIDLTTGDEVAINSATVADKDGAAGTVRAINFKTAGSLRATLGLTSEAEAGSNAGSNFFIKLFADDGVTQTGLITINRATGNVIFSGHITATNVT